MPLVLIHVILLHHSSHIVFYHSLVLLIEALLQGLWLEVYVDICAHHTHAEGMPKQLLLAVMHRHHHILQAEGSTVRNECKLSCTPSLRAGLLQMGVHQLPL